MKMLLISLLLTLSLMLTNSDYVLGQEDECGGPLSGIPFDDIVSACAYYSRCSYPTHKLNVSCLLSSCSGLKGVCPLNSNGSINTDALSGAVTILNSCIGENNLICGYNLTHFSTVQLGWTTVNLLPVNVINGSVKLIPGTGFLDNLSKAQFTLLPMDNLQGSVSLNIRAPYVAKTGNYSCEFDILNSSFLNSVKSLIPGLDSFNVPNMIGNYYLNISAAVSIDMNTSSAPTVKILDDQSGLKADYSNFIGAQADGWKLAQELVNLFNQKIESFIKVSDITSSAIILLATYAATGLQAAQQNCP